MLEQLKTVIRKIPIVRSLARWIYRSLQLENDQSKVPGSKEYWSRRYAEGLNSGEGSYGKFANFKAEIINSFVRNKEIKSVIEFGCGDGNQLTLSKYPKYLGIDVSPEAILVCKTKFKSDSSKCFKLLEDYNGEKAELVLSLDVLFHLIENDIFSEYMQRLFYSANRYVIIYSSNKSKTEDNLPPHVKHRNFTDWIYNNLDNWEMDAYIPNRYPYKGDYRKGSFSNFYIFRKLC